MAEPTAVHKNKMMNVEYVYCGGLFQRWVWAIMAGEREEKYLVRVEAHFCPVCGRKVIRND